MEDKNKLICFPLESNIPILKYVVKDETEIELNGINLH